MSLTWPVFLDRCLGGRRLRQALEPAGWSVHLHDEHFSKDAPDTEWIPEVAARGWVVATRDRRILRNEEELAAFRMAGARLLCIGVRGTGEDYARALIDATSELQRRLDATLPPVALLVRGGGKVHLLRPR